MKNQFTGKYPDAGKDWRQKKKGAAEDEMVREHHWLNWHECEQTLGDSEDGETGVLQPMGLQSQTWVSDWTTIITIFAPCNRPTPEKSLSNSNNPIIHPPVSSENLWAGYKMKALLSATTVFPNHHNHCLPFITTILKKKFKPATSFL